MQVGTIMLPVLQVRKVSLREVKSFADLARNGEPSFTARPSDAKALLLLAPLHAAITNHLGNALFLSNFSQSVRK